MYYIQTHTHTHIHTHTHTHTHTHARTHTIGKCMVLWGLVYSIIFRSICIERTLRERIKAKISAIFTI